MTILLSHGLSENCWLQILEETAVHDATWDLLGRPSHEDQLIRLAVQKALDGHCRPEEAFGVKSKVGLWGCCRDTLFFAGGCKHQSCWCFLLCTFEAVEVAGR